MHNRPIIWVVLIQIVKIKNKFDMKKELTIKQKIKTCFALFTSNSTLSYIVDLEDRCKKANFAPYSLRVVKEFEYFVWDEETIREAENWLNPHHVTPNLLNSISTNNYVSENQQHDLSSQYLEFIDRKNLAIEFAEWCSDNNYGKSLSNEWLDKNFDLIFKSSEDAFNCFVSQTQQKKL